MRKRIVIGLVVAVAVALGIGGIVWAQGPEGDGPGHGWLRGERLGPIAEKLGMTVEELQAALDEGQTIAELAEEKGIDLKAGFPGRPWMPQDGGWFEQIAEQFGLTFGQIREALAGGKTIAELAEEEGVDLDEVAQAVKSELAERTQQAVEDGKLTQEQADEMLSELEQNLPKWLEGEGLPGPMMDRRGGRMGMDLEDCLPALAEKLGMPLEDLQAALDEGKSIPEIAEEQGVEMGRPFSGPGERMPRFEGWRPKGMPTLAPLAEALGMTPEALQGALADGQTIAELAESNKVELSKVAETLAGPFADRLAGAVESGKLAQADTDEMLAGMKADLLEQLESGTWPGLRGPGGPGGPGHSRGRHPFGWPGKAEGEDL